jgi:hypothetical protein
MGATMSTPSCEYCGLTEESTFDLRRCPELDKAGREIWVCGGKSYGHSCRQDAFDEWLALRDGFVALGCRTL